MRKVAVLVSVFVLSFLVAGSPVSAQDGSRRRGSDQSEKSKGEQKKEKEKGRDAQRRREPPPERAEEPRRQPPRERAEQPRRQPPSRERAEEPRRRPSDDEMRRYAVPRNRALPKRHPNYGDYRRGHDRGHHYLWRPYPRALHRPNIHVRGYWEYDPWCGCYVWIQGYCNIRGHYHAPRSGFYFWFDFD